MKLLKWWKSLWKIPLNSRVRHDYTGKNFGYIEQVLDGGLRLLYSGTHLEGGHVEVGDLVKVKGKDNSAHYIVGDDLSYSERGQWFATLYFPKKEGQDHGY